MTHYTPLRDHRNGHLHLSPDVLRIDDHRRIYRRRRHEAGWMMADVFFRFIVPLLALVLFALCWVGLFWIAVGIGRAIRSLTGGI